MVTIHLQDHCAYLDIFTKTDVRSFWVKMCKIEHFLYFRRLSMSWCGCFVAIVHLCTILHPLMWVFFFA